MICVTSPTVEKRSIVAYNGLVASEVIMGANAIRDLVSDVSDMIGGRCKTYEAKYAEARKVAFDQIQEQARKLGANAIVGIRYEYCVLGKENGMMMVAAYGTAVTLVLSEEEQAKHKQAELREAAGFWLNIGGKERGPFSIVQLEELLNEGKVSGSDHVRVDGLSESVLVAEVLKQ